MILQRKQVESWFHRFAMILFWISSRMRGSYCFLLLKNVMNLFISELATRKDAFEGLDNAFVLFDSCMLSLEIFRNAFVLVWHFHSHWILVWPALAKCRGVNYCTVRNVHFLTFLPPSPNFFSQSKTFFSEWPHHLGLPAIGRFLSRFDFVVSFIKRKLRLDLWIFTSPTLPCTAPAWEVYHGLICESPTSRVFDTNIQYRESPKLQRGYEKIDIFQLRFLTLPFLLIVLRVSGAQVSELFCIESLLTLSIGMGIKYPSKNVSYFSLGSVWWDFSQTSPESLVPQLSSGQQLESF